MMNSCQYLLKSKKMKKKEVSGVEPLAPSAYLNELNSVRVLHLGPGPLGTLPPGIRSPWCWVERSRVKIQSAQEEWL